MSSRGTREKKQRGDEEPQLTLRGDRVNYPYLLGNQVLTFQKATLAMEYSEREIVESIKGFVHLIPDEWKDKQFKKQLKEAKKKEKKDIRPVVAGTLRMTKESCEAQGIPIFEEKESINYFGMFQAVMNLLFRRQMLTKVNPVEQIDYIELERLAKAASS